MKQPERSDTYLKAIISQINYRDWDIVFRKKNDVPYVQIQFEAPDSFTGVVERQYCRKWMLSYFMTDSEIVRTVYKAIEAAVLHEMQEDFRFSGQAIFRPHYDVRELWKLSADNAVDKRL